MKISVIIPTRNEVSTLREISSCLQTIFIDNQIDGEIVVADDDSTDGTKELAQELSQKYRAFFILHRTENKGIGYAVKDGCRAASHDMIVIMDSDFSHPPDAIIPMLKAKKEADIVVGSRFVGGKMKASALRLIRSYAINSLSRMVLSPAIHDYTGGYLLFEKKNFS